ncbi:MAG TPA: hypothetical protein DIT02_07810 [Pantoea ananatis]|nr:hypothetical protein [Pantoea ananatis]
MISCIFLSFYYYIYFVINTLNTIVNKKVKNKWKKFDRSGHSSKASVNNATLLKLYLSITMVIFKHNLSYVIS